MYLNDIDVEILVNGKPVKKFFHEGRAYVQANKGSSYAIRVKNNSYKRRMFTVSVDGINVVSGKAAGSDNVGYVLGGYSSYDIQGFRTSNEEVHPFKFNDKQKSYAAKSNETNGDVSNCGVIGVQVYDEKEKQAPIVNHIHQYIPVPTYHNPESPITYCGNGVPGQSATYSVINGSFESQMRSCNLLSVVEPTKPENDCGTTVSDWAAGTEFSKEAVTNRVSNTNFDTDKLLITIEIFYDFREGLIKKGVPIQKEVKVAAPQAFPTNFCKPPKD